MRYALNLGVVAAWAVGVMLGCDEGCPEVAVCDVRDATCQRVTMQAVACMRGGRIDDLPKVHVLTESELMERYASSAPPDDEQRAEVDAAYAVWSRGLSLFGLAPLDYGTAAALADSVAQTAAVYFPEHDDIVIVDRGHPLSDEAAVETFAHEVVHALQHRELDLVTLGQYATSFDARLALDGLIEGEAVLYGMLVVEHLEHDHWDERHWGFIYQDFQVDTLRAAEADRAPVEMAALRFPYAFGGGFVTQHYLARGRAGVDALFEAPPRTTAEMLFGTRAPELEVERAALEPHSVPVLDAPFEERGATALGAWIARMYAARTGLDTSDRLEPARHLGADVFAVHYDAQRDRAFATWRARMLEGTDAATWPRSPNPGALRALDEQEHESTQWAGDFALPKELEMLAWQAPAEGEPSEDAEAAPRDLPSVLRALDLQVRACPVPPRRWPR